MTCRRKSVRLIVVIPVGPGTNMEFVRDTINSVVCYTRESRRIVVVDNTGANACADLSDEYPDVDVVATPEVFGVNAELYLTGSRGYLHALARFDFDVLLRMDVDALIIGGGAEEEAYRLFSEDPSIGALGSYRVDCNMHPRDWKKVGEQVKLEARLAPLTWHSKAYGAYLLRRYFYKGNRGVWSYRRILANAIGNGYMLGEHFMGGAVFFSGECIRRLHEAGLLFRTDLRWSRLADDQLVSLLIRSIGMRIVDFCPDPMPMGLRWRGLPDSPENLVARGKKVIHSTKFWKDMNEKQIRKIFREQRALNHFQ